jgi:hypothetical protein
MEGDAGGRRAALNELDFVTNFTSFPTSLSRFHFPSRSSSQNRRAALAANSVSAPMKLKPYAADDG